jgi:hypothetical protein
MNYADRFVVERMIGRLRALECAVQSAILTHPNPGAFGETLEGLLGSISGRFQGDCPDASLSEIEAFGEGCEMLRRAAQVAIANPGAAV